MFIFHYYLLLCTLHGYLTTNNEKFGEFVMLQFMKTCYSLDVQIIDLRFKLKVLFLYIWIVFTSCTWNLIHSSGMDKDPILCNTFLIYRKRFMQIIIICFISQNIDGNTIFPYFVQFYNIILIQIMKDMKRHFWLRITNIIISDKLAKTFTTKEIGLLLVT